MERCILLQQEFKHGLLSSKCRLAITKLLKLKEGVGSRQNPALDHIGFFARTVFEEAAKSGTLR
jgi:hypothetical protein